MITAIFSIMFDTFLDIVHGSQYGQVQTETILLAIVFGQFLFGKQFELWNDFRFRFLNFLNSVTGVTGITDYVAIVLLFDLWPKYCTKYRYK